MLRHKLIRILTFTSAAGLLIFSMIVGWFYVTTPAPLFEKPYSTIVEAKNGELLSARLAADEQWRFPAPDSIPVYFKESLLTFEDKYFYSHPGFNPVSIVRAIRLNRQAGRVVSGGSTLTMQVIRLSRGNPPRTVFEKITEIFKAIALELKYSKEEILTHYVTHAPFGGNVVGLEAASWRYFNRPPDLLSRAEAATLAVLPNSPSLIFPGRNQQQLLEKRNRLLEQMFKQGLMDELTFSLSLKEPLPDTPNRLPFDAPHLLDRFIADGGEGKRLVSSLDASLQRRASALIENYRSHLAANQIHHMAALIVDVKTGKVLSYVGNSGDFSKRGSQVDMITARRSPGSTLKPLLYFLQLNEGELLPNMLVTDVPTRIAGYAPRNFYPEYDGAVPAGKALARSLNVPAVRNLQDYGVPTFHYRLGQMGITTFNNPPEHYGLSLILGGGEVRMWDLAGVYVSMATTLSSYDARNRKTLNWKYKPIIYTASSNVDTGYSDDFPVHPSAIWHTFEAMQEVVRPHEDVNWKQFISSRKMAWKTGTSVGFRDGWAVGVTPEYVVMVWSGNADGEGRPGLTGIGAAAPAMFGLFNILEGSSWFSEPVFDMSYVEICTKSGHRAGPHCDKTQTEMIPNSGLESPSCPYHQTIHVDKSETYQVNSSCYRVSDMKPHSWFVLPPVLEWYYRRKNSYEPVPDWLDGCENEQVRPSMALIYPDDSPIIRVPVELDGKIGRTVFEAAHREPSTTIWWHLDETYLGETKGIHQIAVAPKPGNYTLTLVDENGETLRKSIQITGGNEW